MSLFPFVAYEPIGVAEANALLVAWGHQMGPLNRPDYGDLGAHALCHEGRPVAVTMHAGLIRAWAGGGLTHLTRENTVELARVCAERRDLNRVVLRCWREFVFPALHYSAAISYQDADRHIGDLYRFDGWKRAAYSRGGSTDQRTGRKGRNRWIWCWPPRAAVDSAAFVEDVA